MNPTGKSGNSKYVYEIMPDCDKYYWKSERLIASVRVGVGSEEGFIREGVWKICLMKYCLITDGNEVMQPATQRSRERTFQA